MKTLRIMGFALRGFRTVAYDSYRGFFGCQVRLTPSGDFAYCHW